MLKISYAGCLGSFSGISSQFTLEMGAKNPCLGSLRSFKVIDVDKSKKPVTSACYDKQHVMTNIYLQPFSIVLPTMAK